MFVLSRDKSFNLNNEEFRYASKQTSEKTYENKTKRASIMFMDFLGIKYGWGSCPM